MRNEDEIDALTGLRGPLAWWVVAMHFARDATPQGFVLRFEALGYLAVDVFFVLSGFVLARRYGAVDLRRPAARRAFWVRRFARIYPLYFLSLIVGYAAKFPRSFAALAEPLGPARLTTQLLAMTSLWHKTMFAINWAAWSLTAEILFYVAFPFVLPSIRRSARTQLPVVLAGLWLSLFIVPLLYSRLDPDGFGRPAVLGDEHLWLWYLKFFPLQRFPEFLAGVALGAATLAPSRKAWRNGYVSAAAAALLVGLGISNVVPFVYLSAGVLLPIVLLVIAGLDGEPRSVLGRPPLVALGRASYATYILHVPVFFVLLRFDPDGWQKPGFLAAYTIVILAVSFVAHHAIEEPARRAITRRALAAPAGIPTEAAR